jgi:hypothetical protein
VLSVLSGVRRRRDHLLLGGHSTDTALFHLLLVGAAENFEGSLVFFSSEASNERVIWREYVYKILTQVSELGEKQCENVLTYLPVAFDLFPGEEVYLVADQKHQFCSPTIYKRQPPNQLHTRTRVQNSRNKIMIQNKNQYGPSWSIPLTFARIQYSTTLRHLGHRIGPSGFGNNAR